MKIFYRVLLLRFVLIIFLESIQRMTKESYWIIISDTRICQLKSMILIYYYRVLENSISKVSPTIATFIKKACTFHAGILFLQLLPYNRKEKGGKTNLFLLHFHFPPIWNCESRAQCHCVFPLSLFLKWHSVTTRGEGERNRRIKHFPPPWRFTRDSFQLGHMLPSTDIWHDIFYRSFNFFLEFKLSKDYFKILIPMRLSKGIVI